MNNKRMDHLFSQVPKATIERSSFNRSHTHKTTFDAGYLVPIYIDEVLPGDTFNLQMHAFARLATPLKPIMDDMYLESFFFFVPNRLIWEHWQNFCGEREDPDTPIDYVMPYIVGPAFGAGGITTGSLSDHFGLPVGTGAPASTGCKFVSLWHRAYNLIWNEWFRDENLQDKVVVDKDDGPDSYTDYVLLRRGKRRDYFTSCLPWPQKGPDVLLPLGSTAPLNGTATTPATSGTFVNGTPTTFSVTSNTDSGDGTNWRLHISNQNETIYPRIGSMTVNTSGLTVDLSSATAATINSLREAFQLQRLFERDARGGTRYTEILNSHFGVTSPDARLQRPEYLGGGSTVINVHPIAQTNATGATGTPQGNLAAFGTASVSGHGFTKSFVEHGVIIGLVNVRANLTYQQGLDRMFSRETRFDHYWPPLAHLGEQAVLKQEIMWGDPATNEAVFGYQERYAEYRYKNSKITGKFNSNETGGTPLDMWHLAQDFSTVPSLGAAFIVENPPVARVIAVPSEPHFIFDSYFQLICARPMPVYGVPGMIDHF